ncbi:hypothetical protein EA462_10365 [Natrarchaeobius halalkaliphilus]|uniref:Pyridoxamine 5'-phosphate oxidase family protein n=1 Tax=Natrarchaeobius halalkaliphilus TaxID=1679091 RepID=A0A3N6LZS2_9EURY|nr:pyridoxamine 5'-phosphate oxidase family protein [Natrarchaeobius halalkaliphilus]RQG88800.1 hypothetical protein EA462_10365 [Natrarchaeobius halalkaliphilus]
MSNTVASVSGVDMPEDEIDSFLEKTGIGTLSFGTEDGGYAVPMSFGFDRDNQRCLFQFVSDDDSTKEAHLERSNRVTLTVYEWSEVDDWRSVVLRGSLDELPDDELYDAADTFSDYAVPVSLSIFEKKATELDFSWYTLDVRSKSGRWAKPIETDG